jgi:hypothetical protein
MPAPRTRAYAAAEAAPHVAAGTPAPARTLELPMRLLGRTVKRTREALAALQPGQVLAVHTDDP